jgi:hypothetical protein
MDRIETQEGKNCWRAREIVIAEAAEKMEYGYM